MIEQALVTHNIQDVRCIDKERCIYTLHYAHNITIQATARQLTR